MPYLGYLLAQALKAGDTIAQAITSASNFVTKVGGSVVDLSPSVEALKSPSEGSAVFNGSSDYVNLGNNLDESLDNDFTVSAWVNSDVTASQFIFHSTTTSDTKIVLGSRYYDLGFYVGIDNGSEYWAYNNQVLNINQWYHITFTWDESANSWKMYLDGNEKQTTQTNSIAGFGSLQGYVVLGKRNGTNDQFYDGNLANVAVWSRVLSASEVRSVMNKSYDDLNASETKGLTSWYALDDISGTTVPDSHGNYNGTAN